uniref:Glucose-1-phosphate adenylyltransferase n=1 Tax=Oryza barthii TaxID=65489 RepID=A0A0D3GZB3_9ORYZ
MNVLASKIFPSRSNVASEQQQSKREKATIDDAKNSSKNKNLDRSVDEPHDTRQGYPTRQSVHSPLASLP